MLRYIVSERATAALLNAFIYEEGIITLNDTSRAIDRNTIRRWKATMFADEIPVKMTGLYFDGKKDMTLQRNGNMELEEHITIMSEPGSEYVTHAIPSGKCTSGNMSRYILLSSRNWKLLKK